MSAIKNEVRKIRFWTPLRLVTTVIAFGLLVAIGVSSCNSNDAPTKTARANTLPRQVLEAENRAASGAPIKLGDYSGKFCCRLVYKHGHVRGRHADLSRAS